MNGRAQFHDDPVLAEEVQRISDARRRQGAALARLGFRNLLRDLQAADFLVSGPSAQPQDWPDIDTAARTDLPLPRLAVPLGAVAWSDRPEDLPVIGLRVGDGAPEALAGDLLGFLSEHHRSPFCRPLFLCRRLDILPFLGRYGFAFHHQWRDWQAEDFAYLADRHGMKQARDLEAGKVLETAST